MRLADLDRIARRQHGIVARRQSGLSDSAWRRALAAGTLIEVHPRVARLVGTADTAEQRIMAAVLAAGPGAVASHRSAAHLFGIPAMGPPPIDLIIIGNTRPADTERPAHPTTTADGNGRARPGPRLDGVTIHRPSDRRRLTPQRLRGIACTSILRTLIDLGAVAEPAVHGAVGHVLTNGIASLAAIEATLTQHARRGRAGTSALRAALDDWAIDAKPADSVLEPAMQRLVANYGLPAVEFHPHVAGREVDFRIIGAPIVIECDGWRYHGRDRAQFERDRRNDAEFAAHGWIVLRFTYRRITTRPGDVADQIRRAVARWTDHPDAA